MSLGCPFTWKIEEKLMVNGDLGNTQSQSLHHAKGSVWWPTMEDSRVVSIFVMLLKNVLLLLVQNMLSS